MPCRMVRDNVKMRGQISYPVLISWPIKIRLQEWQAFSVSITKLFELQAASIVSNTSVLTGMQAHSQISLSRRLMTGQSVKLCATGPSIEVIVPISFPTSKVNVCWVRCMSLVTNELFGYPLQFQLGKHLS